MSASPAGPAFRPGDPCPCTRSTCPSRTPGGIVTSRLRSGVSDTRCLPPLIAARKSMVSAKWRSEPRRVATRAAAEEGEEVVEILGRHALGRMVLVARAGRSLGKTAIALVSMLRPLRAARIDLAAVEAGALFL